MPKKKVTKKPLQWKAGVKHPVTKKSVGGRIMSKPERAVYRTDGKLRKGKSKASLKAAKAATARRKNPRKAVRKVVRKANPAKVKIAQTRKTAPGGWTGRMGPYAIVTVRGNMIKGGSFRSLVAAKKKLAALRDSGRKGLKLVRVTLKKTAAKATTRKANPRRKATTRRRSTMRRRNAGKKRRTSAKRKTTVSKAKLRGVMKKLGL